MKNFIKKIFNFLTSRTNESGVLVYRTWYWKLIGRPGRRAKGILTGIDSKEFWDNHLRNSTVPYGCVDESRPKCKKCGKNYATPYDEDFLCWSCYDQMKP